MSSAVSSTNVPSTPILVTTPSTDTKPQFNDHKREDSNDDQRHLSKQNSNKTYTRVRMCKTLKIINDTKEVSIHRVTVIRTSNSQEAMQ